MVACHRKSGLSDAEACTLFQFLVVEGAYGLRQKAVGFAEQPGCAVDAVDDLEAVGAVDVRETVALPDVEDHVGRLEYLVVGHRPFQVGGPGQVSFGGERNGITTCDILYLLVEDLHTVRPHLAVLTVGQVEAHLVAAAVDQLAHKVHGGEAQCHAATVAVVHFGIREYDLVGSHVTCRFSK